MDSLYRVLLLHSLRLISEIGKNNGSQDREMEASPDEISRFLLTKITSNVRNIVQFIQWCLYLTFIVCSINVH